MKKKARHEMATPDTQMHVGTLIRAARERCGLTLTQLAERVETSVSQLSAIELGKQQPNVSTLRRVAEALDMDLEIGFVEKEPEPKRKKKGKKG